MDSQKWLEERWDAFLEELSAWIAIPSISCTSSMPGAPYGKECRRMLNYILELGKKLGFKVYDHEGHAGSFVWQGASDEEIGIFSHLDVVPEGPGWKYDPYKATILPDKIIGRGTCDDKGPALAALYAVLCLIDSGYQPRHTIRLYWGMDEENGMHDIQYYRENAKMPVFSFTPDASYPVCYGEKGIIYIDAEYPLQNQLIKCYKSGTGSTSVPALAEAVVDLDQKKVNTLLQGLDIETKSCADGCRIIAHGKAAHAAFPEGAKSAQTELSAALLRLPINNESSNCFLKSTIEMFSDFYGTGMGVEARDEISGPLTLVGGTAVLENGIVKQNINIRYPITANYEDLMQRLQKYLQEHQFTVNQIKHSPPHHVSPDTPVIKEMTEICNRVLGTSAKPFTMGGGTYARYLPNAVGYGPGIPGDLKNDFGSARGHGHQPDEYITTDNLKKAFIIYTQAIRSIDELC